jgi:DNA-binding IclR family transcriptional regulator
MEQCPITMRVVKSQLSHSLGALAFLAEAGRGARLTDIAERLAAPKSSVQRLLLADEGWVEQDEATGHYRLSFRMAVLGQRHLQSIGIADATQAVLTELARTTRELARLTIVDGDRLVWIGSAQGAQPGLIYQPAMGGRIVSFATANGKAWLGTLSAADLERVVTRDGLGAKVVPRDVGPNAHRSLAALKRDLAAVRQRGFAMSDQEAEAGVAALAVAVMDPANGRALGTISIAGPIVRLPLQRQPELVRNLRAAAIELCRIWPMKGTEFAVSQAV